MTDHPPTNEYTPDSADRTLKRLHLASTFWFVGCVGFILVMGLREAGFNWWLIFSLSGHSIVILFVLISLYLFALFRGGQKVPGHEIEHPLTSSPYYKLFYVCAPFLGGLAGLIASPLATGPVIQSCYTISLGTFGTTFLSWVVLDPLVALAEMYTPAGRTHRSARQAAQKAQQQEKQRNREALLERLVEIERENSLVWDRSLLPQAKELADLLLIDHTQYIEARERAAEIAVSAWQTGGLACMNYLHKRSMTLFREQYPNAPVSDYIVYWWDGIGAWRDPNLG